MALGDAMGMPAENDVAFNYKRGQFTDDTGQALVLLDSIGSTGYKPDARDIATRMLAWAEKENAKVALANFRDGIQDSKITDKALSNGSAMRIAPIGCLFLPDQKEEEAGYVYEVSKVTHTSDVTIAGAAMIAAAVSSAMVHEDFDMVIRDVLEMERIGYELGCETLSPRLAERARIGLDIAAEYQGDDEGFLNRIYDVVGTGVGIIESVPAAISIAAYAKDPNKSCLLCANLAGDTDAIGAMCTAVCGVYVGYDKINPHYIKTLDQQNEVDFAHYIGILEKGRELFTWKRLS